MISETRPNDESYRDYKETDSFTAENLSEALQLAEILVSFIININPNSQKALKKSSSFKRCCSDYLQVYENLGKEMSENESFENINIKLYPGTGTQCVYPIPSFCVFPVSLF